MGLHEKHSHALLTKREVKIARYWPSSFAAFSWTETKSWSIKRIERPSLISGRLDRVNMVKREHKFHGRSQVFFFFFFFLFSSPLNAVRVENE